MMAREAGARVRAAGAWLARASTACAGLLSLLIGLSILASLPVLQILALGYLLAAGAEVARGGRLRDGLAGLESLARIGTVALGFWLLLWVPRWIASLADSARLIAPGTNTATTLDALAVALALLLCLHGLAALARGGRLRHMVIPRPKRELAALRSVLTREGYREGREAVWEAMLSVRALGLVRRGLYGLLTALVWLFIPTTMLALGSKIPLLAFVGCFVLALVVAHLPFLQLRVASEGRLAAMMELDPIRECRARAPLALAGALLATVLASLPLYLLKIELIPREAMWLPGITFVALMLPARLLCGWALHRGSSRDSPQHWSLRVLGRLLGAGAVMLYAVSLYFTQYLSWHGTWSLYEQHAFMLPVPFLGL